MLKVLFLFITLNNIQHIDIGLAGVYDNKILACPKHTYNKSKLPICANRDLPCGTILNIRRIDNSKTARCVIADRGPFGICVPSKKNTRACGHGFKWANGRKLFVQKTSIKLIHWRGILDMSVPLAKQLGVRKRLVPVFVWTDFANIEPSNVIPNEVDVPKLAKNINEISTLMSMRMEIAHENHTTIINTKD